MTLLEKAFQVGAKRNCKLNYHLKEQCCPMRPWLATKLQCEFKSTNLVRIIKCHIKNICIYSTKLCNYGVMTREPVEGFVYLFRHGLHCSAESVF